MAVDGATNGSGDSRTVGVPTHEVALTRALAISISRLFPPGPGRTTFIVFEPEVGHGRPDAIAIQISVSGLSAVQREGLRLPHLTASRAALAPDDTQTFGVTAPYGRQLRARVRTDGWTERRAASVANLVVDSLAIEAKMQDWRRAMRQVAAFRPYAHRAALLVPQRLVSRVDEGTLGVYQTGLLSENQGSVSWLRPAPKLNIEPAASIWLVELLVRGLEQGTAYSASALASSSIAAKKLSIRPR